MIDPFEKYALEYDNWFKKNYFAYCSELKLIKSLLLRRGRGLDVGVGSGRFAAPLKIKYGIDPAPKMLKLAAAAGIKVKKARAEAIPFADGVFDQVLLVTTLCFIKNINKAFLEIRRVLRPGGRLVVGFVDEQSFLGQSYLKKKRASKFYKKAVFYSVEDVLNLLKQYSFKVTKIKQTISVLPKKMSKPEQARDGFGRGGFIGIAAIKRSDGK